MWWPGSTSTSGGSSFTQIVAQQARAARVEHAARGRVCGTRDVAFEADPLALLAVDRRHRREQRLRVRVVRPAEHDLGRAELHQPPEVQHRDAIREVAHDAEVVRDEEVGGVALGLQLDEQVEDRGLHGHVERRGGLVADDRGAARPRTRARSRRAASGRPRAAPGAAGWRDSGRRTASLSVRMRSSAALPVMPARRLSERRRMRRTVCRRLSAESGFWKTIWSARTSARRALRERRRERRGRRARRSPRSARRCRAACARTSSCRSPTRPRARASRRARSPPRRRRARARCAPCWLKILVRSSTSISGSPRAVDVRRRPRGRPPSRAAAPARARGRSSG